MSTWPDGELHSSLRQNLHALSRLIRYLVIRHYRRLTRLSGRGHFFQNVGYVVYAMSVTPALGRLFTQ